MANDSVYVWDRLVRIGHWLLAIGFALAYITEGKPLIVHTYTGYVIAVTVMARIAWGFAGPVHARFTDFVYKPKTVLGYLADLPRSRARRYLGHSPAGGAMVVALLLSLAGTTVSGMALLAERNGQGPLSGLIAQAVRPPSTGQTTEGRQRPRSQYKPIHEFMANATLVLVFLHLGGVALASLAHREFLPLSMINGRKPKRPGDQA